MEEASASEVSEKMMTDSGEPEIPSQKSSEMCSCGLTNISEFFEIRATAETYKNNVGEWLYK